MGQNTSRHTHLQRQPRPAHPPPNSHHPRDPPEPPNPSETAHLPEPETPTLDPDAHAAPIRPRSRRESLRRSILGLVKPSLRIESGANGKQRHKDIENAQKEGHRRSWRRSRVAPAMGLGLGLGDLAEVEGKGKEKAEQGEKENDDLSADAVAPGLQESPTAGPSSISSSTIPSTASTSTSATNWGDPWPSSPLADHSQSSATTVDLESPSPVCAPEDDEQDEVVIRPTTPAPVPVPEVESEAVFEAAPTPTPAASQPERPPHQFPPPGTLVVVQGVVHTTDVPRTPPSLAELSDPEPVANTTDTPAAPSTDDSIDRSTPINPEPVPPTDEIIDTADNVTPNTSDPVSPEPEAAAGPGTRTRTRTSARTGAAASRRSRVRSADAPTGTISSGSIDVLGTLLSVAAAATAASLLTGTSEPLLLPSNLASSPSTSSLGSNPPLPSPLRPDTPTTSTSQTPAASPSPPPAYSSSPGTPTSSTRPASPTPLAGLERAERLRQAWGSIRERLGLRASRAASRAHFRDTGDAESLRRDPDGDAEVENEHEVEIDPADPREHLFGQMARAFNVGLGLAEGASAQSGSSTGASPAPSAPAPTRPTGRGAHGLLLEREPGDEAPPGSFERFLVDLQADLRVALTVGVDAAMARGEGGEDVGEDEQERDFDSTSVPPLETVSDSEDSDSEFEDALEEPGAPQAADTAPAPTSIPEVDAEGRINWWRLYRFPPIPVPPQGGTTTTTPSTTPTPPSEDPSSVPAPPPPPHQPPPIPPDDIDPLLAELPFAHADTPVPPAPPSAPRAHAVVPVIVVGVQSVHAPWTMRPPTDTETGPETPPAEMPFADASTNAGTDRPNAGTDRTGRTRAWHTRAAEAIRNLRPSRRNRGGAGGPAGGPGSRTFLIYVIGGYYPPNHSILNGGPDTLASLEALLELADLLGHSKPPTASKEDIEKSGLEIIKAPLLPQYEREARISSNCTERCLICLDDYQPEDDVRVMKCRHAFHQSCVDKWLETGRNNCPACRSTGVSVDDMPDV